MANSKKLKRLTERAVAGVRTPKPRTALEAETQKKGYRVVAVSLYTPEAEWIDSTTKALQQAGNSKANRSLVVREAILRLQAALKDKAPADILRDFTEHQANRASGEKL